jgi:hypothetical protein
MAQDSLVVARLVATGYNIQMAAAHKATEVEHMAVAVAELIILMAVVVAWVGKIISQLLQGNHTL